MLLRCGAGQLGQEPGRLFLAVAGRHGGHHQPRAGPGHRDVEQPPLLLQQRGDLPDGAQLATGHDVDELLGTEDAAAQPQVRPDPLLRARDEHHVPLQPFGRVCGQDAYRIAAVGGRGQRVAGQLLPLDVVEEHLHPGPGQPVGEPGGRVEQHHHRVEVSVGGRAPVPAPGTRLRPALGQPARLPQCPERVLGCGARPPGRLPDHAEQMRDPPGGCGPPPLHGEQLSRVTERVDQQYPRRPPVTRGQRDAAQPLPQLALGERVGTAQRGVQQGDRGFLVQPLGFQRAPQREQHRGDRRMHRQR